MKLNPNDEIEYLYAFYYWNIKVSFLLYRFKVANFNILHMFKDKLVSLSKHVIWTHVFSTML